MSDPSFTPKAEDQVPARSAEEEAVLDGVEALVAFLRARPGVPIPYELGAAALNVFTLTADEFARAVRAIGGGKKHGNDSFYWFEKTFGPVRLHINVNRSTVCRKIVVGTRDIPEHVEPARTVEVVEWACEESVLDR